MAYGEWAREVGKAASNHNRAACLCPQAIAEGLLRSDVCRMIYFGISAEADRRLPSHERQVIANQPTVKRTGVLISRRIVPVGLGSLSVIYSSGENISTNLADLSAALG